MSRVINDRDMVEKTLVPSTVVITTNPSAGDVISNCTYTTGSSRKVHVLAVTVSGSAAGAFYLNIDGDDVFAIRVSANGMSRTMFYYNTLVAEAGETVKLVAADNLTGTYEACMELYDEAV